jgi:hypothetical protein
MPTRPTSIFTAHHPQHALAVADDALLITGEANYAIGPVREILTEANLETVYGAPLKRFSFEHRADVFSLLGMPTADAQIEIPSSVKDDLARFLKMSSADAGLDPQSNTGVPKAAALARFKTIYNLV